MTAYRKVLVMVLELHMRGFQQLRIEPAISPSGTHWRCAVAPARLFSERHGARLAEEGWESSLVARYTTGQGERFFDWRDVRPTTTPSGLANRFVARFHEIAEAGRGSDWAYTGWYVEMLHLTYPDLLPYALADWGCPRRLHASHRTGRQRSPRPATTAGRCRGVVHSGSTAR
jgi:hypothetical protein